MNFKNTYSREILTAKAIKDIRKNLGMSCRQFAKFLRLSNVIISMWEKGQSSPRPALSDLMRIKSSAEYLEANKEELKVAMFRKPRPSGLVYRKAKKESA